MSDNPTIKYLELIEKYNTMIKNRKLERLQLLDIACCTTSRTESVVVDGELHNMDKVQGFGKQDKMAEAITQYVDLENDFHGIISLIQKRDEIIRNIELLNVFEYDVLFKKYVQGKDYYEIADECNKSHSWATSIHGRALKNLQKILDEKEAENE